MGVALFNTAEALLWFACGTVAFYRSRKLQPLELRIATIAAATFILFGISDLIEIRTGAWWNPPALMYFKGACIFILFACAITWYGQKWHARKRG